MNDPGLWGDSFAFPGPAAHKYLRGHLLVLGGREPTLGASRLASMAGLRVGAGLVTLAAPSETYAIQATALTDIMVRRFDSAFGFMGLLADNRINSVLIGPGAGVGEKTAEIVQDVGRRGRQMVLDADALTSLVGRLDLLTSVKKSEIVLTPHEGEFARLFPSCNPREDRVKAARDAARLAGSVIVLKGASTVVAAPDGRASIAANAPSWLSVAGTGDVLGGMIAGLMAQGMPAFEAASAGVWLHGEAGTEAGRGLVASDLLSCIPSILP
nr:NAD(P)H-hydrate dehydratase [Kordiimonas marina]